jgi:hypothetical protein
LSASILEQLTTPLHDFVAPRPQVLESSEMATNKAAESNHLSTGADQGQETKVCLCCCYCQNMSSTCVTYIRNQALGAGCIQVVTVTSVQCDLFFYIYIFCGYNKIIIFALYSIYF